VKLDQLSVQEFIGELSSGNPTPGGGSVAALCGALGAALSTMVANLTVGREKYGQTRESMEEARMTAATLSTRFLALMQEDSDTYQKVMAAFKLPRETDHQKASRQAAIEAAMKKAANGPMEGILQYCEDPIVSSDVIANPHSSVFDSLATMVVGKRLVKLVSWYDNEWGYSNRVVDLIGKLF